MNLKDKKKNKAGGGGFQSYNLDNELFKAITAKGYNLPTPIQRKAIPVIL
jgi:ATP-dependent RNA helicase DDX54/DBP10